MLGSSTPVLWTRKLTLWWKTRFHTVLWTGQSWAENPTSASLTTHSHDVAQLVLRRQETKLHSQPGPELLLCSILTLKYEAFAGGKINGSSCHMPSRLPTGTLLGSNDCRYSSHWLRPFKNFVSWNEPSSSNTG